MSIYAKSKIAFCFTTFIVLQAVRYASFSKKMYLFAMLDYAKAGGGSRGSALYTDSTGELPGFPGCQTFGELYRCRLDQKMHGQEVQEVTLKREHRLPQDALYVHYLMLTISLKSMENIQRTDGYDGLKVKNTQAIVSRTRLGISYSQIPYLLSFISLYNSINSLAITLAISVLAI